MPTPPSGRASADEAAIRALENNFPAALNAGDIEYSTTHNYLLANF